MLHLAAIQLFATPFALEANLSRAARLIGQAQEQGAQLALLPELFNSGYTFSTQNFKAAEPLDGPTASWLREMARTYGLYVGGSFLRSDHGHVFNSLVLAGPSGDMHIYNKAHPFLWEGCYFERGTQPVIAETELGRIGLMVCWDIAHREPVASYKGKVDLVLVSSAPACFHRAVINFPAARKLYLAQLNRSLIKLRGQADQWYAEDVGRLARCFGAPIVHSVMSGRFVSSIPFSRASLIGASLGHPRFYTFLREAPLATMRANFFGTTAIYAADGERMAQVDDESGVAVAEVSASPAQAGEDLAPSKGRYLIRGVPRQFQWLELFLGIFARRAYRKNRNLITSSR